MIPVIAIIGRPNVGKSTLFNRLTHSQQALVLDEPGITRDIQFGQGYLEEQHYMVVDTGGIGEKKEWIDLAVAKQAHLALLECDVIFFVVDARQGLHPVDQEIARILRKQAKPVCLVINKSDGMEAASVKNDFYRLGFTEQSVIAASHNRGIEDLLQQAFALLPGSVEEAVLPPAVAEDKRPIVAIIGRPNVGKSTLVNRLLGQERMIVCDMPGTTRDSVYVPVIHRGKSYTLIDTAGIRKKKKVFALVEKFSAIKTMQAIKAGHVVVLLFDAKLGLSDQDLSLISFTVEAGKCLIICPNKWDGLDPDAKKQLKESLEYRLKFADFAIIHPISALHGTGVGDLFRLIDDVYESAMVKLKTNNLNTLLEAAVQAHPPPLVQGRRIKLRYAHCGGHNPPTIVIHGSQTDALPQSYQKYLSNYFIKALGLEGTPVSVLFRSGENPFAGKRNILTKRQLYKRQRLMKHVKKGS